MTEMYQVDEQTKWMYGSVKRAKVKERAREQKQVNKLIFLEYWTTKMRDEKRAGWTNRCKTINR